ncbi:hypothetical protein Tco_1195502, partial [Tanacetum coccineum]
MSEWDKVIGWIWVRLDSLNRSPTRFRCTLDMGPLPSLYEYFVAKSKKIRDRKHKTLEGKVVLVGDDGLPFRLVNTDTQATRAGVGDVSGDPKAWDDENPKEAVVRDKNMPNE